MTVGIPGWLQGTSGWGIPLTYLQFMRDSLLCDDLRVLTLHGPIYTDLDLLILPGGADVNPARYGDPPSFYTDKPDLIKEYFDVHILPEYINRGTPVFGICRGAQTLAVHFGCKLVQDMDHETNPLEDPYKGVHQILVIEGNKKVKVNSRHHQSIYKYSTEKTPVKLLAVHSTQSHHIEAIRVQGYKIAAVQYHPEDLAESTGRDYAMSLIKSITA